MSGAGKRLLVLLLLTGLGFGAAGAAFAAFTTTTKSQANSFQTGSVVLTDNDGGTAMLSLTNAGYGATDTSCIKVSYSGSLSATVREYATVTGSLAPYLSLTVTRGSGSTGFDNCTGFTADSTNYVGAGAGVIFSGHLSTFPASYATGIVDPYATSPETWTNPETHDYKFQITLDANPAAAGLSSTATFSWQAGNT